MLRLPDLEREQDKNGTVLYIRLYESIKESILAGSMEPGEKLPSKRKLAGQLGVSVTTVENAYSQLLLEGYICSREKSGYYVERLENYRVQGHKNFIEYDTRFRETEYRVNLRANRNSIQDFPAGTWSKLVRETLSEEGEKLFKTVPFNGLFSLRKAIAKHLLQNRGMQVSPDQIIIGAGTEYMYSRLSQELGPDNVYALTDPCTKRLRELYKNNRLHYKTIPATPEGFDVEQLEKSGCDVLHIAPAHQYPLGKIMPIQERIQLLQWADKKKNRYIIEDDYDSEYIAVGRPVQPLYAIDVNDKVIYMNTFSKSVSPAVRISYMVLPEPLMQRYLDTVSFYTCTVASLEQYALAKFIEGKHLERYIHRVNRKNQRIRQTLLGALETLEKEGVLQVEANCAGPTLLVHVLTNRTDQQLKEVLRSRSIITPMLSEYYEDCVLKEKYAGVMVLNYSGLDIDGIDYLCEVLKEQLKTGGTTK